MLNINSTILEEAVTLNIKKLYEKYIYILVCCFFLLSAAVIKLNELTGATLHNLIPVTAALLFSVAAALINVGFSIKKPVIYITGGAVALCLFSLAFFFDVPFIETINSAFYWLLHGSGEENPLAIYYALISILLSEVFAASILFALMRFYYVRLIIGALLFAVIIIMGFLEYNVNGITVFFIFCYLITVFCELLFKIKKEKFKNAVTYLLPFMLGAGMLTAVLPSSETPIQWNSVKNIIWNIQKLAYNISDSFIVLFNTEPMEFNINISGYSDSGEIQGELIKSEREALAIKQKYGTGKSLYLTGTIMDTYTGTSWKRTESASININTELTDYELDLIETLLVLYQNGMIGSDIEETNEIPFSVREINVSYKEAKTRSLFYPLKTMRIFSAPQYTQEGNNFFLETLPKIDTNYNIKYLDINYGSVIITQLLNNITNYKNIINVNEINSSDLYSFFIKHLGSLPFASIPENYAELLKDRQEDIKERYTALPDVVGQEVYNLAQEITEDCDNDYDKMKALESFLSDYNYTLTPPALLSGELTSWFLFEVKEGYCTYFATALSVMARTLGIPTRYVQGYATDFNEENLEADGYIIKESNAHAWVEAYINGFGWIPFEAVPQYATFRYTEWELRNRKIKNYDYGNYFENIPDNGAGQNDELMEEYNEKLLEEERLAKENQNILLSIFLIIGVVVVTAGTTVFITIMLSLRKKKKILNTNTSDYYLEIFKFLMLFLNALGYKLDDGETIENFTHRIKSKTEYVEFEKILPVYQKTRYGSQIPSADELNTLLEYRDKLALLVKNKIGRIKYIMLIFYN